MSKSDELRAVIGAMTARPWAVYDGLIVAGTDCAMAIGDNERANEAAIAALANHADAFVDLVRASERLKAWDDGEERSYQEFDAALYGIMCALRRVHEIGDGT